MSQTECMMSKSCLKLTVRVPQQEKQQFMDIFNISGPIIFHNQPVSKQSSTFHLSMLGTVTNTAQH